MASEYVIDAFTLVDALTIKDSARSTARLRLREATCHAPHLIDAEVGSALRRKVRRTEINDMQARRLLRAANHVIAERYAHHGPLAEAAWLLSNNLSFYDAIYAALATQLRLPLLTADQRLANAPGLPCTVESLN